MHVPCARLFVCAEVDSNRGPSDYQPNALPLGQTGSHDSELVTAAFYSALLNSPPTILTALLISLLYSWYHVKLLSSWRSFCVHHTAMHQFTVSVKAIHVNGVHACSLPPSLLRRMTWNILRATAVTRGME